MTTSQPAPGGQMPVGQPDAFGQPSAPKKSKLRWLRFAIPVLVVVIGGGLFLFNYFTGTGSAQAGECLSVTEFSRAADEPKKADCGAQEANVKIAARVGGGESCPEGDYDTISMSGRISYKLCLIVNANQGDCLTGFKSDTAGYQKVSCTDPAKDAELVKIANVADKASCEGTEATAVAVYSTPPTTICIKTA
ncbi:hypothetical protein [Amycolatopsis sp. EV170708-02-1]|uniref:LppU/SCO3897 family protein n=1 Tax=Amycolatopsis sp. EV170708-02-1 TaxID=2919322 RepID=UPI001F0C1087|nr:hypothetical protein [Amycolatopsis sp. EV170708-02-1]UMP06027.1 hypothetical protein MJQ72_14955 [Amycolatopsis sp. EV170708-02-1]